MPVAGGGFEQCYNAQAVVAVDSLLVVAPMWYRPSHLAPLPNKVGKAYPWPRMSAIRGRAS